MSGPPRPIREILADVFPMSDTTAYCVRCNHLTPHARIRLHDRTAWVCKQCDEAHTSKDPED